MSAGSSLLTSRAVPSLSSLPFPTFTIPTTSTRPVNTSVRASFRDSVMAREISQGPEADSNHCLHTESFKNGITIISLYLSPLSGPPVEASILQIIKEASLICSSFQSRHQRIDADCPRVQTSSPTTPFSTLPRSSPSRRPRTPTRDGSSLSTSSTASVPPTRLSRTFLTSRIPPRLPSFPTFVPDSVRRPLLVLRF